MIRFYLYHGSSPFIPRPSFNCMKDIWCQTLLKGERVVTRFHWQRGDCFQETMWRNVGCLAFLSGKNVWDARPNVITPHRFFKAITSLSVKSREVWIHVEVQRDYSAEWPRFDISDSWQFLQKSLFVIIEDWVSWSSLLFSTSFPSSLVNKCYLAS